MTDDLPTRRSWPARLGIVALNLLGPGLGLLRTGRGRTALILLLSPFLLFGVLVVLFRVLPQMTFGMFIGSLVVIVLLYLLIYGIAFALSWRSSAHRHPALPWYGRWYGITAVALLGIFANVLMTADRDALGYRSFYVPSGSMEPTLVTNDRFVALMRAPEPLRRGDIVLVDAGDHIRINRVAALPGDHVALVRGVVILNGSPVAQRATGRTVEPSPPSFMERIELEERFPGEGQPHRIYDSGLTPIDDFAERRVPDGHVFLLGDNRDDSADSRLPTQSFGLGMVPVSAIRGTPLFHSWRGGSRPSGTPVGG